MSNFLIFFYIKSWYSVPLAICLLFEYLFVILLYTIFSMLNFHEIKHFEVRERKETLGFTSTETIKAY